MRPSLFVLLLSVFSAPALAQTRLPSSSPRPSPVALPSLYVHGFFYSSLSCTGSASLQSLVLPYGECTTASDGSVLLAALPQWASASDTARNGCYCEGLQLCQYVDALACASDVAAGNSCGSAPVVISSFQSPPPNFGVTSTTYACGSTSVFTQGSPQTISAQLMSSPFPDQPDFITDDPFFPPPGSDTFAVSPSKYAAAAGASVVIAAALSGIVFGCAFTRVSSSASSSAARLWAPRALRAWHFMFAAHALLTMGACTGIASLSALWASVSATNAPAISSLSVLVPSTVFTYIGLLGLVMPAAVMAAVSAVRLRRLAVGLEMPPPGIGCAPSSPAIQATAWAGSLFYLISGLAGRLLTRYVNGLDVWSAICLVVGSVCSSVAGCCVMGAIPGLGSSRSNPCCVAVAGETEGDGLMQPPPTDSAELSVRAPAETLVGAGRAGSVPPRAAWTAKAVDSKEGAESGADGVSVPGAARGDTALL